MTPILNNYRITKKVMTFCKGFEKQGKNTVNVNNLGFFYIFSQIVCSWASNITLCLKLYALNWE